MKLLFCLLVSVGVWLPSNAEEDKGERISDAGAEYDALGDEIFKIGTSYGGYTKRYKEIITLATRQLEVAERNTHSNHISVGRSLRTLSKAYESARQFELALSTASRSLAISESRYGKGHYNTVDPLERLSSAYENLEMYSIAIPLYLRAIKAYHSGEETNSQYHVQQLQHLFSLYQYAGQRRNAERTLKKKIELLESGYSVKNRSLFERAMFQAAEFYVEPIVFSLPEKVPTEQDYLNAKNYYDRGMRVLRTRVSYDNGGYRRHSRNLLRVNLALGHLKEAKENFDELSKYYATDSTYITFFISQLKLFQEEIGRLQKPEALEALKEMSKTATAFRETPSVK